MDQLALEQAIENYDKAITIDPGHAEAFSSKGVALKDLGETKQAIYSLEKALSLDPDNVLAKHNLALVHLLDGNYKTGWRMFEHRWRNNPKELGWRDFPMPVWDGSHLHGKSILVWGEQGIGDEIVYASLYHQLMEQGAKCYFECLPRLVPLFQRSFPEAVVVAQSVPMHPTLSDASIDFQIPAASLMQHLLCSLEGGASRENYLCADPEKTKKLRQRYQGNPDRKLVGLSWRTSHASLNSRYDIPLHWFDEVLKTPNVQFVNLQYGDHTQELAACSERTNVSILQDFEVNPLEDMDAFAAQVASMDLVVSIVTSTAAMASAVGTPVWGIVPTVSEWRWGNEADRCLWYPSMSLFRQHERGDWQGAFDTLVPAFRKWATQAS